MTKPKRENIPEPTKQEISFPDTIFCGGRPFTVDDLPELSKSEGTLGLCDIRAGKVYIDECLDVALTLKTLWHEALHIAQNDFLGDVSEEQSRWGSLFVHQFLIENPAIVQIYQQLHVSGNEAAE